MGDGVIRWEDPPDRWGRRNDWAAIGAALVSRPRRWAHVLTAVNGQTAAQMARHIGAGKYSALAPLGRFEAKSRTVDGEPRVYARYIGEAGSEATPSDLRYVGDTPKGSAAEISSPGYGAAHIVSASVGPTGEVRSA